LKLPPEKFYYLNPPFPLALLQDSPYLRGKIRNQVHQDFIQDFPQAGDQEAFDFWIRGAQPRGELVPYPRESDFQTKQKSVQRQHLLLKAALQERRKAWMKWKKSYHRGWVKSQQVWRNRIKRWEREEDALNEVLGAGASGGGFWELPEEHWEKVFQVQEFLQEDSGLKELAALLGRLQKSRKKTIQAGEGPHLPSPGREEILGLEPTGNLNHTLPSEWFSLLDPRREMLFYQRWVEGKLLGYHYGLYQGESAGEKAGPFLVCFDTSGSMRGKPELMAKAFVSALVRIAQKDQRAVYLINFSQQTRSHVVEHSPEGKRRLLEFLQFSFASGTDLNPALAEALRLLRTQGWEKSDLVVVSDFSIPKIQKDLAEAFFDLHQRQGNRHYCLTTSGKPFRDRLNFFDQHWAFNLDPRKPLGIFQLLGKDQGRKAIWF
jgi:uncharacterized protein with von Willebrand factor type A (vWA) domain